MEASDTAESSNFDYSLRGKDWTVYWLLLKNGGSMGAREIQRTLHFSSPSVALHHLEQLRAMGLVQKLETDGSYSLVGQVKIGVLRHFVKLGRLLFPRYFFYAMFSSACVLAYAIAIMRAFTGESLFVLVFGGVISFIFWYEAYRVWSLRPF